MTTMRVIVEELLGAVSTGGPRYTGNLTRALIDSAPPGCFVEGVVAASTEEEYARVSAALPGHSGLFKSSLARRELVAAWQHGFTRLPSGGMIHAPSLLAPLASHDRVNSRGQQIVVTMHDVAAWTHPELLGPRRVAWHRAMVRRAEKYADAVVVPTHAVADRVAELFGFGDRVRVIASAVPTRSERSADADGRAARLGLPPRYIATTAAFETPRTAFPVMRALALPGSIDLPLVVLTDVDESRSTMTAAMEAGLPERRIVVLGGLDDADRAVALDRAELFAFAGVADGFGASMLEAFHLGTPVIHADAAALLEVAADAGVSVPSADPQQLPQAIAAEITRVLGDDALRARLAVLGLDRARLFSWQATAEKVWQLHADL
jgi:glycosyltransferase involved in cell wall biosynthesis